MNRAAPLALIGALLLSGCGHIPVPNLTRTVNVVVKPPETLYVCPQVVTLPDYATLKDSEVAALINDLWADLGTCSNNMQGIHDFEDVADKTVKTTPK